MNKTLKCLAATILLAAPLATAGEGAPATLDSLRARIKALEVPDVAWRQIPWKSCLLEGIRESKRLDKPLLLWVFIDRPVGDTRC